MPIGSQGSPVFIAGFGGHTPMQDTYVPAAAQPPRYCIYGQTMDLGGSLLAGCTVEVFETATGLLRGSTVSDANANYSLDVTVGLTFFLVAYLPGAPDRTGATVNTVVGTPS